MQSFKVSKNQARLDLFLKEALKCSRKEVKRLLDAGRIWVGDRKVIIASWELKKGDKVTVAGGEDNTPLKDAAKDYFLKVVFEDEHVLVVEKDSGTLSEKSPTALSPSLPEIVYAYLKRVHPEKPYPYFLKIHRLDQGTSGLMVYGKTKQANPLLEDFKQHRIHRRYLCLVEGQMKKDHDRIDAPLLKTPHAKGAKMRISQEAGAKKALTEYRVKQRYPHHTLVEVDLKTGRTHQVRAHMAYTGHPVVGDNLYGRKTSNFHFLALHASELGFNHPVTGKKLLFRLKPPKHFRVLVERKLTQV